jgi:signal transduction histidine kinase
LKKYKSEIIIFAVTFVVLGLLIAIPLVFLQGSFIRIILYQIVGAIAFMAITVFQIHKHYKKPLEQFSEAARKVANGDFSVYVPSRNRSDRMDFLDIIFRDFNKMVEELGSIETLKTEFFSNVSHEIRTPLSVIQNYAEMLQKETLTAEQRLDYTTTILGATRRLSDLISNMLKLNKLEKQTISPVPEPYDLCRQLCECSLLFEVDWEKKGIEFIAEIEDYATINADASLLEIVWNNLLSNAVKFTEQGGTVTLWQTSDVNSVTVSVSDSGCGMDEETKRHIFDKFYQGDSSHATEGNGLGLALVRRIVELADGSITVDSEVGQGSTFTVYLPLILETEAKYNV